MTPDVVSKFETTSKALSKGRKKRVAPPEQADAGTIADFKERTSQELHSNGPVCVDTHVSEPLVATGGADGRIHAFDCASSVVKATMSGHSKHVSRVRLHPSKPILLSCSHDGSCVSSTDG